MDEGPLTSKRWRFQSVMAEFTSTVMVPENVHEVLGVNIASVGLVPSLFAITLWPFILVFFMVSC